MNYWHLIESTYENSASYLWKLISKPILNGHLNSFYFLIVISLLIWGLEIVLPWRKKQKIVRRDFWLDTFYMFFNFFLFDVLIFAVLVKLTYSGFSSLLFAVGWNGNPLIDLSGLNWWLQVVIFFVLIDFIQWVVHVILHRVPFLWRVHKVHHSVKEMGFAAHLRYHFVENMLYRPAKYVMVSLLFGFQIEQIYMVYYFSVLIGHLNHANLGWDYGPLKYIFNNPKMHIWHHAKDLPESHPYGMNFGISLSLWDYIFRTNYVPASGRDIELGFEGDESYADNFLSQLIAPFKSNRQNKIQKK